MVRPVVADDRANRRGSSFLNPDVLPLRPQLETILDGQQKPVNADAIQGELKQGGLLAVPVHRGVCLEVQGIDILVHVDGVLIPTIAETTTHVEGLKRVNTVRATGGVPLKLDDNVFLIGLEATHDGLD